MVNMPRRRKPAPAEPVQIDPPVEVPSPVVPAGLVRPETLLHLLGLLGLVAVALTVPSILSPFTILAGALFLLFPYRDHQFVRRSLVLASLLVGLWAFNTLFGILTPFLFAYLLAYIFDPLVGRLAARGIPRWAGSAGIVLLFVGGIASGSVHGWIWFLACLPGCVIGIRLRPLFGLSRD